MGDGLSVQMRDLLAKASVVAEAAAAGALDSSPGIAHLKPGATQPRGQGTPLRDVMAERFAEARTRQEQAEAIRWAQQALRVAKRNPGPPQGLREPGSLPWRREIAQEALAAKGDQIVVIARKHSISRATVYRYRDMYGEAAA